MAEQKDVPTGPKGGVRVTDDDTRTVRSTQNVDPRDNTPTADQHEAQRRANDPQIDKQGHKSYGGGGQKLKFERDYWPAQQPENKVNPDDIDPQQVGLVRYFSTVSTLSRLARLLPSQAKRLTS